MKVTILLSAPVARAALLRRAYRTKGFVGLFRPILSKEETFKHGPGRKEKPKT